MLSTNVRVSTQRDASGALDRSTRRYVKDGAQKGFNVAQDEAPAGATGFLKNQSAIEPTEQRDGSVFWGFGAEYARYVNEGTVPHWIPVAAVRDRLIPWARRVLGNENSAWGVRQTIAEEGTDPNPFFDRGVQAMRDWYRAKNPSTYFDDELGGA